MADASMVRHLYREQGFVMLPGAAPKQIRKACLDFAARADESTSWVKGDESDHAWDELALEAAFELSELLSGINVLDLVSATSSAQWINRYAGGEFIPGHKDAAGDAHLLLVIEQSVGSSGGQLWLGSEERVIPMGQGDAILFPASQVVHGMTPMMTAVGAKRMTLNVRLWVGSHTLPT